METAIAIDTRAAQVAVARIWSPQQNVVIQFGLNGRGHGIVIAVAGSGKTSVVLESIKQTIAANPGAKILYLVFGSDAQKDAESRLEASGISARWDEVTRRPPQVEVKTFHSKAYGCWRKANPDVRMEEYEGEKLDRAYVELGVPEHLQGFVKRVLPLAKQSLIGIKSQFADRRAWEDLVDHFDLWSALVEEGTNVADEDPARLEQLLHDGLNWAVRCMKHGILLSDKIIDFDDQLYMTLMKKPDTFRYSFVYVDEMQDSNIARIEFVKYILWPRGGRSIWVGDPFQAIMGFTGADARAVETIKREFRATELPLTWSYRCPKVAVRRARQIVPHIQEHPDAPEGEEMFIEANELFGHALTPEDAVICRNTAPLVELFWQFLKRNIPAHIEGKKIGEQLVKLVNRWQRVKTTDGLVSQLEIYREKQVAKALARRQEKTAEAITESVDALLTIIAGLPAGSTLEALKAQIKAMFVDSDGTTKPTLTLSTMHKSKGREWRWVYIYGANRWNPSKYARQEWQIEQEDNLMYVALTRTKFGLVHVKVPIPARKAS